MAGHNKNITTRGEFASVIGFISFFGLKVSSVFSISLRSTETFADICLRLIVCGAFVVLRYTTSVGRVQKSPDRAIFKKKHTAGCYVLVVKQRYGRRQNGDVYVMCMDSSVMACVTHR